MLPADLSRMKILIVDDEAANVLLLRHVLRLAGYETVEAATDSREALPIFRRFRPDLLLLDLLMPGVSGFEIMRLLQPEIAPGDYIPVLVLTADVTPASRYRALQSGASDFLTKPFDNIEVALRIRHLLQIRSQHLELTRRNVSLEDAVQARTAELTRTLQQLEGTVQQIRQMNQSVIRHERMSAVGSMAAGLAHDFNNSISLILGYGELLMNGLRASADLAPLEDDLRPMMTAAQDAAKMFGRLREFYRPADKGQPRKLTELNALVEQAVALTRPRWHGQALGQGVTIDVDTNLCEGLPPLLADAAELREMLTNLIFNAVDAMPQGGTITLRTRWEPPASGAAAGGLARSGATAEDGTGEGTIVLEVTDTGTGIDEETRRRCLEPFFTTKGKQGTGLGLAMVYGTMQRHGGSIDLQSLPGSGTAVVLRLPSPPCAAMSKRHEPTLPASEPPRRILVVDDQSLFLKTMRRTLTASRHEVETARDGGEALDKFRARLMSPSPFELVITDQAMPKIRGDALAAAVKALAPRTRVILLTGVPPLDLPPSVDFSAVDLTVCKPVTVESLRETIGRLMSDVAPSLPPSPNRDEAWMRHEAAEGTVAAPPVRTKGHGRTPRPPATPASARR